MGSTGSKSTVACATQPADVDRVFACPVCFEKFSSHIMQCKAGHALCENCANQVNRCPQCNKEFLGTRNFILEDIIYQFQQMNLSPESAVKEIMELAVKKALPIPNTSAPVTQRSPLSASFSPPEPVVCRMKSCRQVLMTDSSTFLSQPSLHMLSKHSEFLLEPTTHGTDRRSDFYLEISCSGCHRYALLTELGVFFLIIRSECIYHDGYSGKYQITAWVQGACSDSDVKKFYSGLRIEVNFYRATYHDIVQNNYKTVPDIEGSDECLKFSFYAKSYDLVTVDGYTCLNKARQQRRRRITTDVEYVPDY
ncbi:Zinc finger, RING/FYVE/PHD-type [Sergentomyia squamirostris]